MKTLSLVIELKREWDKIETFVVLYTIRDDVTDPNTALRNAVQDFINSNTEIANATLESACQDFNWGDVMSSVPDEYFINRGLTPMHNMEIVELKVNHDEVLDNRQMCECGACSHRWNAAINDKQTVADVCPNCNSSDIENLS